MVYHVSFRHLFASILCCLLSTGCALETDLAEGEESSNTLNLAELAAALPTGDQLAGATVTVDPNSPNTIIIELAENTSTGETTSEENGPNDSLRPTLISPTERDTIPHGLAPTFSWSIDSALMNEPLSFDLRITDTVAKTEVYRNEALPKSLCNVNGECQFTISDQATIQPGENHQWQLTTHSNGVKSAIALSTFNVGERIKPINPRFLALKKQFDEIVSLYPTEWSGWSDFSQASTSYNGYNQYPALFSLVKMYRLSGDRAYLDLATNMSLRFVSDGKDIDNDGFNDWNWGYNSSTYNQLNKDHYEWRSAMGISFVLAELSDNEAAQNDYTPARVILTNYLANDVWQKWTIENAPLGRSNNATSGTDLVARLLVIAANLHTATGESQYLDYVESRGKEVLDGLNANHDTDTDAYDIRWRSDGTGGPNFANAPSMDIRRAQDVLVALTYLYENGYNLSGELTESVIGKLVNIVNNVILQGDNFTYLVNGGSKTSLNSMSEEIVTHQIAGWTTLSKYDNTLTERFIQRAENHFTIVNLSDSTVSLEDRLMIFANLAEAVGLRTTDGDSVTSTDPSNTSPMTSVISAPTLLYPHHGADIEENEQWVFKWNIPAELVNESIQFDISIFDATEGQTIYQDNTLQQNTCNHDGFCEVNLSAQLDLTPGSHHTWRMKMIANNAESGYAIASFGLTESIQSGEPPSTEPEGSDTGKPSETDEETEEKSDESPTLSSDYIEFKQKFDDVVLLYPDMWYTQKNLSATATSNNGYHQYPALYGLAKMYHLTGDNTYLQLATDISLKFVNDGSDMDGDGYQDWEWGYSSNYNRLNHDHYEWRTAMGISYIAAALSKTHDSSIQPNTALETLKKYLEHDVWDKWTPKNAPSGRSNNATLGVDFVGRLLTIAMNLHMMTGESKYLDYINSKGRQAVEVMISTHIPATDSYDMRWRIDGTGGPNYAEFPSVDVSHAQDMVIALTYGYENGFDFGGVLTSNFIDTLTSTAKNVVYAGENLTFLVNGGGRPYDKSPPEAYVTSQVSGWAALAKYDEELLSKFADRARTHETITNSRGSTVSFENRLMLFSNLVEAFD